MIKLKYIFLLINLIVIILKHSVNNMMKFLVLFLFFNTSLQILKIKNE